MAENGNGSTKQNDKKYTKKYEQEEINPLRNSNNITELSAIEQQQQSNAERTSSEPKQQQQQQQQQQQLSQKLTDSNTDINVNLTTSTIEDSHDDDDILKIKKPKKIKGTYQAVMTRFDITEKSKCPFFILLFLCLILLITIIFMGIFWPTIPFYMSANECIDKECLEASKQLLLWANLSTDACKNPYEWACGNFENDYIEFTYSGNNDGEWNVKSYIEYQEMYKIHSFFAKIPKTQTILFSPQYKWKELYTTCMSSNIDKKQADAELRKLFNDITPAGWLSDNENFMSSVWDFEDAMIAIQHSYGIFPFFKISVEQRNSYPFNNIITLSEGEVGLPNKYFYNLNPNHRIIQGYLMLMRDFAINYGFVSEKAKKFAENVFYYEQRLINAMPNNKQTKIIVAMELKKRAPLLPISEIIDRIFTGQVVNANTPILVYGGIEMLQSLSTLISTTDKVPLNDFLIWSVARHFLPFMSKEYITSLEEFKTLLYGHSLSLPQWYFCSKLLKNWMPFAVKVALKSPELFEPEKLSSNNYNLMNSISSSSSFPSFSTPLSSSLPASSAALESNKYGYTQQLINNYDKYNNDLIKMIFYHIKNELIQNINGNVKINYETTNFLIDKLKNINLYIGTPHEIIKNVTYLNKYYKEFHLQKSSLIENIKSYWTFKRIQMVQQLLPNRNHNDKLITELYTQNENYNKRVHYSNDLNAIIISDDALDNEYFHYKYPIAVNFARLGIDIGQALFKSIYLFIERYKDEYYKKMHTNISINELPAIFGDTKCFDSKLHVNEIPYTAKMNLYSEIVTGRFVFKTFIEFLRKINSNQPIEDSHLSDYITYEFFGLHNKNRQPGLRKLDDHQLFSLTYLQRHCSGNHENYKTFKPFVENHISEHELFNIIWDQIPNISNSMLCSENNNYCESDL